MISTTSPITDQSVHSSNTSSSVNPGVPTIRHHHHHHHNTMTYDPYLATTNATNADRNNIAKVPEFLRPLPKPARYNNNNNNNTNGIDNNCTPLLSSTFQSPVRLNGIRPNNNHQARIPNQQQQQKYIPPRLDEAVNLVHKKDYPDEYQTQQRFINTTSAQQYTPPSHYYTPSNVPMVTHPYTPIYFNNSSQVRPQVNNNTAYIHIPNTISSTIYNTSPPKPGQSILKDTIVKPPPPQQQPITNQLQLHLQQKIPFKVPSGKEGSLKHRILTRPVNENNSKLNNNIKISKNGPLHPSGAHFARGSLIQLASGELRKIEDMRTEDFITAAEKCPALRMDPSTVVRITENSQRPQEVLITLSYGRHNPQQVELEVSLEHPFFVYGKGWASISPERSLHNFDLPCHRLNVGDICISLSPRPSTPGPKPHVNNNNNSSENKPIISEATRNQIQANVAAAAAAAELLRKRRWSAPDQFHSDDENNDGPTPSQRTKDNSGF